MTPFKLFLYSLSAVSLLSGLALGSRDTPSLRRVRRDSTPSLPIAPGTTEDCDVWYDNDGYIDCEYMPEFWEITLEDFLVWNPSITASCENFLEGYSFCVKGHPGTAPPATTASTTAPATTTKAPATTTAPENGVETPEPVQPGVISNCNKFYLVKADEGCQGIADDHGITLAQFTKWNSKTGTNCVGLWVDTYACVSVIGYTPTPTEPDNGIETPSPIQNNMDKNCNKFHLITATTTCTSIEDYYKLSFANFYKWNPAVGSTCTSLLTGYYVCIGVVGYTTPTTTPTTPDNGISTPSPIQTGMTKDCNKFHLIKSTTTCASIKDYYNLPLSDFYKWNPAVGTTCTSLLVDYYVCVSVIGYTPPTPTDPANGISTPSPVQTGITKNCNKFHLVQSTTTCTSIQDYYKITFADFYKWNPAVGSKCTSLLAGVNVCVGIIGGSTTPTNPGNGIATPQPIQAGMTTNCKKFHLVQSTTTCASIRDYYKITIAQLYKLNPAIGSTCKNLWTGYNVCIGT